MSTDMKAANDTPPAVEVDLEAEETRARLAYLTACADHQAKAHILWNLTDMESAEVSMQTLLNAFLHGFDNDVRGAMDAMEEYVRQTISTVRHTEACKLILPPSLTRQ